MRPQFMIRLASLVVLSSVIAVAGCTKDNTDQSKTQSIVDKALTPVIQQYGIPGMAVAVTLNGERYFFNYGVASLETRQAVTGETLFEIGSLSKTFTATLASYAQTQGNLSLTNNASLYLPALRGSEFDRINLINLGTHTAGGLPLQVPESIKNTAQLMSYFKSWKPAYEPGTYRAYSNLSIGLLGVIAASSLHTSYQDALEMTLFPALGMVHSYIDVPAEQMHNYAQGYTKDDVPARLNPGVLAAEAYGVKTSTIDLVRFLETNMQMAKLDGKLQRALDETRTGYFKSGEVMQDLIWEQYPYPVTLERLLAGNSDAMIYQPTKASRVDPPLPPQTDVWINKTGSTNGFAAYAAYIPAKKLGIVILANKNYPIAPRVTAAHQILTQLAGQPDQAKNSTSPPTSL